MFSQLRSKLPTRQGLLSTFSWRQPVARGSPSNAGPHDHTVVEMQGNSGAENEPIFVIRRGRGRIGDRVDTALDDVGANVQPRILPSPTEQANNTSEELHVAPTFLKTHFDLMYYLGISPINGNGEWGSQLQRVAFGFVTLVAMLHTFAWSKQYIVDEAKVGVLQNYINAWFYISSMLLQLGFLWMILFRSKTISEILQESETQMPGIRCKIGPRSISKYAVMFASLEILVALTETAKLDRVVDGDIKNAKDAILSHSHRTSMLFFLWGKGTNGTDNFYILHSQYGVELTPTTMGMGMFGVVLTFIGILQENAIKDILLMTALHIFRLGQIFQSNVIIASSENNASDQLASQLRNVQSQLSEMANTIESCFGNFFKLVHAHYLLFCAYILAYFLTDNVNPVIVFECMVVLLKIACILYCPTNAIGTTENVKDVIRKKFCADDCPNDVNLKKVILLLQTIEERPISIGRGNFLVDETFSLKFIGAVVTFFLFLLEADGGNERRRRR